ncbi:hypothetical protein PG988_004759 [Apiospora saccharicola]
MMTTLQRQTSNASVEEQGAAGVGYKVSDLLALRNPEMEYAKTSRSVSKNENWVLVSTDHIDRLDGFTNTNLDAMYEDLLNQAADLVPDDEDALRTAQRADYDVECEGDFGDRLRPWLEKNALYCINKTIKTLQDRLGASRKQYRLTRYGSLLYKNEGDDKGNHLKPDWAIVYPNGVDPEGIDLAGETKRPNMNPAILDRMREKPGDPIRGSKSAIQVLRQCATYAWLSRCRFHLVEKGENTFNTVLGVEYDYFPYRVEDLEQEQPTLCKAIWAQMMMAQNPQHCDVVPLSEMVSLSTWYKYTKDAHTYYIHHISEVIRETLPGSVSTEKVVDIFKTTKDVFQRIARGVNVFKERASGNRHQVSQGRVEKAQSRAKSSGGRVKKRKDQEKLSDDHVEKKKRRSRGTCSAQVKGRTSWEVSTNYTT